MFIEIQEKRINTSLLLWERYLNKRSSKIEKTYIFVYNLEKENRTRKSNL